MIHSKKKTAIFLLVLIVALFMFGCGNKDDSDADKSSSKNTTEAAQISTGEGITSDGMTSEGITSDGAVKNKDNDAEEKTDSNKKASSKESDKNTKAETSSKKNKKKKDDVKKSEDINITISIDCKTLHAQDPALANKVSNKGIILGQKTVTLKKDSTVLDALKKTNVDFVGSSYVSSINGLSEKDGGKLSGWLFQVNGKVPMESCNDYKLKNGDEVKWRYTCESGTDI